MSDFLDFPVPLPDPQTEKPDVGLRTFTKVENFIGIIVLQFVDHPRGGYGIWFYHDCAPPTGLLWLLLCLCMWGIFFWQVPVSSFNGCSIASCNFDALAGGDEHTSFYSTILN